MMDYAKAHYFDGIKGNNVSADKITENLHPFQEMYFDADGNAVWVYNISDVTDVGICADGYFDDPWEMEGAGYNKFRSSNNAVIQHENLVVIQLRSRSLPGSAANVTENTHPAIRATKLYRNSTNRKYPLLLLYSRTAKLLNSFRLPLIMHRRFWIL